MAEAIELFVKYSLTVCIPSLDNDLSNLFARLLI